MKKIGLFLGNVMSAVLLGNLTAFACRNNVSVYGTLGDNGFDAVVSCQLTGEDANYCYYDCTCTGNNASTGRCDQLYAAAGLSDV